MSSLLPQNETLNFGSSVLPNGLVKFSIWAPSAKTVELIIIDKNETFLPMKKQGDGWYELATDQARDGSLYMYLIDGKLRVPDPASRYQPHDVDGPSMVIRDHAINYREEPWMGRPWTETVIYELHVGTFSEEGTFRGVEKKLDYLKELGVTAIELMPIADFPGSWNWGYDGVLLFAPDSNYGTPDDLRNLIESAHKRGLMVFLDVVYNHFGPQGNYLYVYAKPFFNSKYHTPWGAAINFDGKFSNYVRQFFIQNALYWINEYKLDGLRFDAVNAIFDSSPEHIINEIARKVRETISEKRHVHLMVENDSNKRKFLVPKDKFGCPFIRAQWNDDIHHALHVIATNETGGYYGDYSKYASDKTAAQHLAKCLSEGFAYQGEKSHHRDGANRGEPSKDLPPYTFISFIQNHDQVGNRAYGERLPALCKPEPLNALTALFILAPNIPMFFMGQEFDATSPFNFFCDMEPSLGKAITRGRRNEFRKFPEFASEEARQRIPDPLAPATFDVSKLDWTELKAHSSTLVYYQQLLKLRTERITPLLADPKSISCNIVSEAASLLCVEWLIDKHKLTLIANLTSDPNEKIAKILRDLDFPNNQNEIIFCTHEIVHKPLELIPGWCTIWILSRT